jgi:hypothetical protein
MSWSWEFTSIISNSAGFGYLDLEFYQAIALFCLVLFGALKSVATSLLHLLACL